MLSFPLPYAHSLLLFLGASSLHCLQLLLLVVFTGSLKVSAEWGRSGILMTVLYGLIYWTVEKALPGQLKIFNALPQTQKTDSLQQEALLSTPFRRGHFFPL